ncbi:MAG: hypothetical protein AB8C84_13425 [Oligoflexales bacterium]
MSLNNYIYLLVLSFSALAQSNGYFQIHPKSIVPVHLNVYTNGHSWIVESGSELSTIKDMDLDPVLKERDIQTLSRIIQSGRLPVAPCGDAYKIYYSARGLGRGFL